jgi:ribonuclease E
MVTATARIVVTICTCLVIPVRTFSQFGLVRNSQQPIVQFQHPSSATTFLPRSRSEFFVKKKGVTADEDDEDFEPDESDLVGLDADIDDDVSGIAVEEVVVASSGEDEGDDTDDNDDIDLEDIDIWEEDDSDDEDIVVEGDEEWEEEEGVSSYLMSEGTYADEDWDEDEGNTAIPLQDDPDDPHYQAQKKILEETIERRQQLEEDKAFDEVDFIMNKMTPEQGAFIDAMDIQKKVEAMAKDLIVIDENDVEGMDPLKEIAKVTDVIDDPYENDGEENILGTGISDDKLEEFDETLKGVGETLAQEPWDKVNFKANNVDWAKLPNQTLEEMDACLDEIGGSAYNVTNWLLYDLDFNVSNLVLAAVKHNRDAPVLFQHWYPQLLTYERYQHTRDRDFDFNWHDVENADMSELERYYMGFGYSEIPDKAPAETGIISFEDLDEEELKMAAFENWMTEVYNPEWDRKDFDDDAFQDEDNVHSKFYVAPQHPDLPVYEDAQEDLREWEDDVGDDEQVTDEYANMMGQDFKYKSVDDEEFRKEFRGHVVVACTPSDGDLEIAEKITARMAKEFGKQIYVETRVIAHAREEDFVFEVWLESYDIDLLHSKKRASANVEGWDGPVECDDQQIDYLVKEIRFLISDDARYSYRFAIDMVV